MYSSLDFIATLQQELKGIAFGFCASFGYFSLKKSVKKKNLVRLIIPPKHRCEAISLVRHSYLS
jgi:hypothetical protein